MSEHKNLPAAAHASTAFAKVRPGLSSRGLSANGPHAVPPAVTPAATARSFGAAASASGAPASGISATEALGSCTAEASAEADGGAFGFT